MKITPKSSYSINGTPLYKHKGVFDIDNDISNLSPKIITKNQLAKDIYESTYGKFIPVIRTSDNYDEWVKNQAQKAFIDSEIHNVYNKLFRQPSQAYVIKKILKQKQITGVTRPHAIPKIKRIENETICIKLKRFHGRKLVFKKGKYNRATTERLSEHGLVSQLNTVLKIDFEHFFEKSPETRIESFLLLKILFYFCKMQDNYLLQRLSKPSLKYVTTPYGIASEMVIEDFKNFLLSIMVPNKKKKTAATDAAFVEWITSYSEKSFTGWDMIETAYKNQFFTGEVNSIEDASKLCCSLSSLLDKIKRQTAMYPSNNSVIVMLYFALEQYRNRCIHYEARRLLEFFKKDFFFNQDFQNIFLKEENRLPLFLRYDRVQLNPTEDEAKQFTQDKNCLSLVLGHQNVATKEEESALQKATKNFHGIWRIYDEHISENRTEGLFQKTILLSIFQMLYISAKYNLTIKNYTSRNIKLNTVHNKISVKPNTIKKNRKATTSFFKSLFSADSTKSFSKGMPPLDSIIESTDSNQNGRDILACILFPQLLYARNSLPDAFFEIYLDGLITLKKIQEELCKYTDTEEFKSKTMSAIMEAAIITKEENLSTIIFQEYKKFLASQEPPSK